MPENWSKVELVGVPPKNSIGLVLHKVTQVHLAVEIQRQLPECVLSTGANMARNPRNCPEGPQFGADMAT